jgi:hypothetical protein
MSIVSWIGLPFESWYAFERTSPASESRTPLVDVEPPSMPTNARTVAPAANVAGVNFLGAYARRKA